MSKYLYGFLFAIVLFSACSSDDDAIIVVEEKPRLSSPLLPDVPYDYESEEFPTSFLGGGLPFFDSTPDNNPQTNAGVALGRVLFYDTELSLNRTISCGSCHLQANGFADPNPFSQGHAEEFTSRNSMTLTNMQFNFRYFWDIRVFGLEGQVLQPIEDPIEMNLPLPEMVDRVQTSSYYPSLFEAAFGDDEVTTDRVAKSLAQFVRSLKSYKSPYDEGLENDFANFSAQEIAGKDLFFGGETKCNQCHFSVNFWSPEALINGLDKNEGDLGVGAITGNISDFNKFKVPTLRNLKFTAPYMHDGRFETLAEVIEHYNDGVKDHPFLDDRLTVDGELGGAAKKLNLSDQEKSDMVEFLETLSDESFINDERFSDPFYE